MYTRVARWTVQVVLLLCAVCSSVFFVVPVKAIDNPTSVSIGDVFVFTNLVETGDQLFFVRYDVSYSPEPTEDAEDTWLMAIYDTDGSTLLYTRPLNYYQHNIISIYLTPAQALTWGTAYKVRVMGSPSVFDPLIEGTNMRTSTLSGGNYREIEDLSGVLLDQAQILENDWGVALLTTAGLLNTTGAFYFLKAVPNLNAFAADIFQTTVAYPEGFDRTWAAAYGNMLESHAGPNLTAAFVGFGDFLGVSWRWAAFWLISVGYLTAAGIMYSVTKNAYFSILMSFPVVALFTWLGVIQLNIILVLVFTVVVMFAIYFILERFA